ncbi:NAD-glutamate dehydrogenase domain-containing protein [Candidatus Uabimicrobium sp. HlEnr_7]|uniref:NAD-glutamate dehydrogenase domain-containing protein n=1 Tax=Candidatus Uabimicrobium helgolandensis TaxID=3095367 RepID=UPI003557BA80
METNIKNNKLIEEVSDQVKNDLIQAIEKITPWFFSALHTFYYQMTPKNEQIDHLHTIISLKQTNVPAATLQSADGSKITYISVRSHANQFLEALESLADHNIRGATMHTSREGDYLALHTFFTATSALDKSDPKNAETLSQIRELLSDMPEEKKQRAEKFINGVDSQYLMRYDSPRLYAHILFFMEIKDYETVFNLDNDRDEQYTRISLCTINPPATGYLYQVAKIFHLHEVEVNRMYVNIIELDDNEEVVFITAYGRDKNGEKISTDSVLWQRMRLAIKAVKWVVEDEISTLAKVEEKTFSVRKVNLIRAMAVFVHQFLSKVEKERYTYEVVKKSFLRHAKITELLTDYFYIKFNPTTKDTCPHCGTSSDKRNLDMENIRKKLTELMRQLMRFVDKEVFNAALSFVDNILKTNYFIEDSIGLAFRMDPEVLDSNLYETKPFGFFFFFGRGYKGYHIRFEDMSRGGLRIVRSRDSEHYDLESTRVFDEVYGLSSAQQLKNKDIPEGGSKGILLLQPGADVKQSVECAIDSLLDLLITDEKENLHPRIVDYYSKEEIIYLGPDENVTDDRINWIVQRAKNRNYKYPNAFMSSKPGVGINHKEYGVTSHGVNVYVEACLYYLKIDPQTESFTVRMIGGPDGDVAGNELKILISSYPQVKIVAISDGGGAAYDVKGLNHQELLRLVEESKSITEFKSSLLSKHPQNFVVNANTIEGRQTRDELQVSNRIKTDLLIPAGGRPNTINIDNWQLSLDEKNVPVFNAVVEGANLFLTNEARYKLEEMGVVVIKDSSANKGGVICSSYEIIASLILSEKEFLDIKDQYVTEVIDILEEKARKESKLLFREYKMKKIPLTTLSSQISIEINELTDILKSYIRKDMKESNKVDRYQKLLKSHCPPILAEKYSERIIESIPEEHQLSILASQIASHIIYREGLGWVKSVNYNDIPRLVDVYLDQDSLVIDYISRILASDLPGKEVIAKILDRNARKELTREALHETE